MQASFEKQLEQARRESEERLLALKKQGLAATDHQITVPHLMNISDDPALSGHLLYPLGEDRALVVGTAQGADLVVNGVWTTPRMAELSLLKGGGVVLKVTDPGARVIVNGHQLTGERVLVDNDRVMFGKRLYRVVVPGGAGSGPKGGQQETSDFHEDLEVALADSQSYKEVWAFKLHSFRVWKMSDILHPN